AFGLIFWSLSVALTGAFRYIAAIMAFRILVGIGQSVAFPASARAVANWFHDRERGTVNSGYLIGVRLGTALTNSIGANLIGRFGWQLFFGLAGILPLVWVLPWMMFLRPWEKPAGAATKNHAATPAQRFTFATSFG